MGTNLITATTYSFESGRIFDFLVTTRLCKESKYRLQSRSYPGSSIIRKPQVNRTFWSEFVTSLATMSKSMVEAWLAQLPTDLETPPKKRSRRERGPYRPIRLPVRKVLLFQPIRRMPKSKRHGTKKRASAADKLIPLRHPRFRANCSLRPDVSRGDDQLDLADTGTVHSHADIDDNDIASERNDFSKLSSVKFSAKGSSRHSQSTTRTTTRNSLKFYSPSISFVSPQNGRLDGKAVPADIQDFQRLLKGITAGQGVIPIILKVSSLHHPSH